MLILMLKKKNQREMVGKQRGMKLFNISGRHILGLLSRYRMLQLSFKYCIM